MYTLTWNIRVSSSWVSIGHTNPFSLIYGWENLDSERLEGLSKATQLGGRMGTSCQACDTQLNAHCMGGPSVLAWSPAKPRGRILSLGWSPRRTSSPPFPLPLASHPLYPPGFFLCVSGFTTWFFPCSDLLTLNKGTQTLTQRAALGRQTPVPHAGHSEEVKHLILIMSYLLCW